MMKQVKNYCTRLVLLLIVACISCAAIGQTSLHATITDQYDNPVEGAAIRAIPSGATAVTDSAGVFKIMTAPGDSFQVEKTGFEGTARSGAIAFSINDRGFVFTGRSGSLVFDNGYELLPDEDQVDGD